MRVSRFASRSPAANQVAGRETAVPPNFAGGISWKTGGKVMPRARHRGSMVAPLQQAGQHHCELPSGVRTRRVPRHRAPAECKRRQARRCRGGRRPLPAPDRQRRSRSDSARRSHRTPAPARSPRWCHARRSMGRHVGICVFGRAATVRALDAHIGLVAQWSELAAHNRLVAGSNPAGPTTHSCTNRRFPVSDE